MSTALFPLFDSSPGDNSLGQVIELAASVMTYMETAALLERVRVLQNGKPPIHRRRLRLQP